MNGSQIVSEQWDDKLLVFLYDESGSPIGMQYRTNSMAEGTFYTYLFEKNLQGDIIAIYNTNGTKLISYVYDAWGNFRQTNHNVSGTNAGAQYNPFTYRGYYCDTELELYYLQSRYYDPFYGRFINADSYLSTGTGLLGYNMYAYCNNNPVNMIDVSGNMPEWVDNAVKSASSFLTKVKAVAKLPSTILKISLASTVALVSGQASAEDIWNDVRNYKFFNDDETQVLNSKVFSSYKGTPVIRHNISGITSFSISNTIILNRNENVNKGGINTVKHEWGHTVQQSIIGTPRYIKQIAIPSIISCIANPSSKTYYSLPWERSADYFGGVNRSTGYYRGSDILAGIYFIMP